jgi:hypothetical protein
MSDKKYCEIRQIERYEVKCPYCNRSFECQDGSDFTIDVDLPIKCIHCDEESIIPDF